MAFAAFSSNTPNKNSGAPIKSSKIVLALLLPGLIYLAMFFFIPLVALIQTSLEKRISTPTVHFEPAWNWQNYVDVIDRYLPQILRSFGYAFVATVIALLISYPLAYFIGVKVRHRPVLQRLMVTLVIAPFFISFLLRTIAWKQLLADNSLAMDFVRQLGLVGPNESFIGTGGAVVFGLVYNFIPFMTLPLYTTLERLDVRYLEAGSDLYASPSKVFRKVTLPLSMPGIISGTLLTFIPIAGDYVNASQDFLGSTDTSMIGTMVVQDQLVTNNPQSATALSVLLMGTILVLITVYVRRAGTEELI